MNVFKLIQSLELLQDSATTSYEYMTLSKAIQLLKLGRIQSVATIAALPTNLTTSGNLYYVTSEEELYYNQGATWYTMYGFTRIAYAWGAGNNGRLGTGATTNRSSPVTVIGGITTWSQISAGDQHSLGVTTTGIAYAWGSNANGRLGDGTTTSRSSPVTVVGGITSWKQLSASSDSALSHSLGVTTTGLAYAWGNNNYGQLGSSPAGYNSSRLSPVLVTGGIGNWTQVSAGNRFSLGLTAAGIAYAWGSGYSGRLGDNTTVAKSSPVTVVGGITTWRQLAAGYSFSIGLTTAGLAYAWGYSSSGALGTNNISSFSSPVTVVGGITTWSQASAGRLHSIATTTVGVAYAWGSNVDGQLGDNTTSNRSSPVTVVGGITNWAQLSAARWHSLGLTSAGIAYGWGRNAQGQIGDGTLSSRLSPVTVVGGITNWSELTSGTYHSAGITSTLF
jgi:alpha-tubulin suppressor-like RCC1 family protein